MHGYIMTLLRLKQIKVKIADILGQGYLSVSTVSGNAKHLASEVWTFYRKWL